MIKNKRGSHVGRVLSFIIFIVFFVYFYSLLGPEIIIKRDKDYLVNYLETEIKKEAIGDLKSITVRINDNSSQECLWLHNLTSHLESDRIKVKNEEGVNISAIRENDTSNVFFLRQDTNNVFFKVYISEEFDKLEEEEFPGSAFSRGSGGDQIVCNAEDKLPTRLYYETNYTLHTSVVREVILLSLIQNLIDRYQTDYGGLREDFNFPGGSDFGFGIQLEDGTIIQTPEPEIDKDIYVQRTPIEYFTQDAERKQGFLIIKVW